MLSADTTYTLTLNGTLCATTTVRVFPDRETWFTLHFNPAELGNPLISGGTADADGDGFTNDEEYHFQTNPHDAAARPLLSGSIVNVGGILRADFTSSYPLDAAACTLFAGSGSDLTHWTRLPSNSFTETSRDNLPGPEAKTFYRAGWKLP